MTRFSTRRMVNITILIIVAAILVLLDRLLRLTLRDAAYFSGWLLLTMVLLLAAYNVFKKFPYFPLGASAVWLQGHIYVGLLAVVVFGLHIGPRVPNGVFESVLATLFGLVASSGILGLLISRMFARRLTARGGEILFDRIPRRLRMLRRSAESIVRSCLGDADSTALPEFYRTRLEPFFAAHRNVGHHLVHSSRPQQMLSAEIDAQVRYMNDAEVAHLATVADMVVQKHDLDYQFAHQVLLRYWLFIHIPLTYVLLLFAVLHVILVHAF